MAFQIPAPASRLLIASGLFLGVAAAHAAGGFSVDSSQESLVLPGMNTTQVQVAIGRAAQMRQFGNLPGPTWTYRVDGNEQAVFDVDFDANGRVISANERLNESGRSHGGRR